MTIIQSCPKASSISRVLLFFMAMQLVCANAVKAESSVEKDRLAERAKQVTIIRDDFGVPHIYGKTDADAVFGLLYAQAEDDFHRIERNYIWAIGRLAEVEGEQALFSDLRARLFMSIDEAKAAYDRSPEWLKKLCDAFADGLNWYLITHPEVEPLLLTRFEPWMPMFFSEGSIGGNIEKVALEGIEAFYGSHKTKADVQQPVSERDPLEEPQGSNGFAISGALTRSGNAMLLINPHTSFYFRAEVHVVSGEGLNAYGAVTWGQFFIYQGFNQYNGWMHTSTKLDFMDEYIEDLDRVNGQLVYRYGDELRRLNTSQVVLRYKTGSGFKERLFPVYRTHRGPITHTTDGRWVSTRINWEPVEAIRQSFIRTKTRNYKEFRAMMDIRANSSNNTVYADSDGNIAYFHGNFVPRRNPSFNYSRPVDGSNAATDWQGKHDVDELLTILNPGNGWLQNCNSTPFTAAGAFSPKPTNYTNYMASDPENFRGIHAVRVLSGQSDLTIDKLIDLAYDPHLPGFEKLIPGLIAAFDRSGSEYSQLTQPIERLRNWNFKTSVDSIEMTLAHFYGTRYLKHGRNPKALKKMALVNYFGTDSPDAERLQMFQATIEDLEQDFGSWVLPWGEVNRLQRLTGDILQPHDDGAPSLPVSFASGSWGALASFGAKRFPGTRRIYGKSGNSFVAVVEFGPRIVAKSILVGGQNSRPASPHFDDQLQRYVDRDFKDVAFYRDDVERRATRKYRPGLNHSSD